MRILVVAATSPEVAPLVARLALSANGDARVRSGRHGAHDVDLLTTGVGMVATAAWCSRALTRSRYDLAVNVGVCGAFDRTLDPGTVVHVVAELGAEDGQRFLTIQEMNLLGDDEFPFTGGRLVNATPPANAALSRLPAVSGITVNTVHGNERSIADVVRRFNPQVESMEGAGFMYACLLHDVPFAQIRSVSNVVETRNRESWKLAEAIRSLNAAAFDVLNA